MKYLGPLFLIEDYMVLPWGTPIPFTNQKLGEIHSLPLALDNRVAIEQGRDISMRLMCKAIVHINST